MIAQYIKVGDHAWNVLVYYWVGIENFIEIKESLLSLECPTSDIHKAFKVLRHKNTGFTYTNTDYKMSIVCIGKTTTSSQFVNTAIHEAKHVLSHICKYYKIGESTEHAAYLIGYIVQRMYKMISKLILTYV